MICSGRLEAGGLCDSCRPVIPVIGDPACDRCGCPGVLDVSACPNCREKTWHFDRLIVPWPFGGEVQDLLHGLKYEGKTYVAPVLAEAIAERIRQVGYDKNSVVVPVPLHAARLRERGYNQSRLLAAGIARTLGLTTRLALRRVRPTETQTELGLEERVRNVDGAFRVRKNHWVAGQPILLVDDVCTTGSTVNACASVLLAAGAAGVTVVAAASPYHIEHRVESVTDGDLGHCDRVEVR